MKVERIDDESVRINGEAHSFGMEILEILELRDRIIVLFENYEWPDEDPNLGRNIFAYDANGNELWRVQDAEVMIGGRTTEQDVSSGYTDLQLKDDGKIYAWAMDWRHELDPETGKISNPEYFRQSPSSPLFALDFEPTHVNAFNPPAGARVKMNYSIAGRNTYGPGGGVQFQLAERAPAEWFEENRRLIKGGVQ